MTTRSSRSSKPAPAPAPAHKPDPSLAIDALEGAINRLRDLVAQGGAHGPAELLLLIDDLKAALEKLS